MRSSTRIYGNPSSHCHCCTTGVQSTNKAITDASSRLIARCPARGPPLLLANGELNDFHAITAGLGVTRDLQRALIVASVFCRVDPKRSWGLCVCCDTAAQLRCTPPCIYLDQSVASSFFTPTLGFYRLAALQLMVAFFISVLSTAGKNL